MTMLKRLPIWSLGLLLGGCVMHQGAAPPPAMPAYIPPGSALGISRLAPPVPISPAAGAPALPGEDEAVAPVTPFTPGMGVPEATPPDAVPPDSVAATPMPDGATPDGWQLAAPGADSAGTAARLDEIRARLAQDRAAPPRLPSRFGGLSDSGDVTPPGN